MYADFQENIFAETSGKKFQTFQCKNVTTKKVWNFFPQTFQVHIFFLKIGIRSSKVFTKNVLNREICDSIPAPSRTLSIKQVIVAFY